MICRTTEAFRTAISKRPRVRLKNAETSLHFVIETDIRKCVLQNWNALSDGASLFLDPAYLQSVQTSLKDEDLFRFALFFRDKEIKGIAVFHMTRFEARSLESNFEEGSFLSLIRKSLAKGTSSARVMICGNAFATGEHGFAFRPDISSGEAMDALCYAITSVVKAEKKADRKISAIIVKDLYPKNKSFADSLQNCGFRQFQVDRNMIMPVHPDWTTAQDYLESMITKFRTKANAAYKRSAPLSIRELTLEDMKIFHTNISDLYNQVQSRAEFRLGKLNATTLCEMKGHLKDRMIVRGYFLDRQIVGFSIALDCGDRIDAHLVGINYTFNQEYAIYQRMLYDFTECAIVRRKKWIIYGRTAGEIKSTVGALPTDLVCSIRHTGKISNLLLNWLFAYVRPSQFAQRNPWKKLIQQELEDQLLNSSFGPDQKKSPFKHTP